MIGPQDVNQFLPHNTNLPTQASLDQTLLEHVTGRVLGVLRARYAVDTWTAVNVPEFVKTLIAMMYAGLLYNREFAEESSSAGSYGFWLINQVNTLLTALKNGHMDLEDEFPVVSRAQRLIEETPPAFSMGDVF